MLNEEYIVSVPLCVPVTKKKKFYLNLNQYRNAHHFTLSKAKINFHDIVAPLLKSLPQFKTVNLIFTLFPGSEQLLDTSNVCSIIDKFFSDVLVSCKKIEDDNRKIVLSAQYRYGAVDRANPRCEVSIIPGDVSPVIPLSKSNQEEPTMQITIVQTDIEEAIRDYIGNQITIKEGMRIDIDLRATRGPEGYQAIIDIVPANRPASGTGSTSSTSTGVRQAAQAAEENRKPGRPASVTKQTASEPAQPKAKPEVTEASTNTSEDAQEAAPETAESTEAPEASEASEATGERKSLFGALKKPENA